MRLKLLAAAIIILASSSLASAQTPMPRHAPKLKMFVQNNQTYRWFAAHGVTGSLVLSKGEGIEMVITCSGAASGGLQVRSFKPAGATRLSFRTGASVLNMDAVPKRLADTTFVAGQGGLPQDFFVALGAESLVDAEYGSQKISFPGPGRDLAEHLRHYCEGLDARAARNRG